MKVLTILFFSLYLHLSKTIAFAGTKEVQLFVNTKKRRILLVHRWQLCFFSSTYFCAIRENCLLFPIVYSFICSHRRCNIAKETLIFIAKSENEEKKRYAGERKQIPDYSVCNSNQKVGKQNTKKKLFAKFNQHKMLTFTEKKIHTSRVIK